MHIGTLTFEPLENYTSCKTELSSFPFSLIFIVPYRNPFWGGALGYIGNGKTEDKIIENRKKVVHINENCIQKN